jgi:hypothetical protein
MTGTYGPSRQPRTAKARKRVSGFTGGVSGRARSDGSVELGFVLANVVILARRRRTGRRCVGGDHCQPTALGLGRRHRSLEIRFATAYCAPQRVALRKAMRSASSPGVICSSSPWGISETDPG